MTPYVPISVSEIVEDVHEATEIGITMVHLHARHENTGEPTYKSEVYGNIIEKIRVFSKDLVICVSLSGRTFSEFEKRADPLQLTGEVKPDMGSLTLSSVNFNRHASVSSPEMILRLAREMQSRGILAELEAYAPLTSVGSYCVVFDTVVEDMSDDFFEDRPWGKGDNPKTAVWEWLKKNENFEIDKEYENKLLLTVAPDGFLKRVR
jgi:hypothetical protein